MKNVIPIFLIGFLAGACATRSDYEERSISILTLSLFNQRIDHHQSKKTWKGDWLYRRERLELVDLTMLSLRPDLVLFQEALARRGSPSESDRQILSYGSLDGYQWVLNPVDYFEDTQEEEYFALAMGVPLRIMEGGKSFTEKLGKDGGFSLTEIQIEDEPLWILNVELPTSVEAADIWYDILRQKLLGLQERLAICNERLVVGGYLPSGVSWPHYLKFLETFQLKDTSIGFCEVDIACQTASPKNEIFRVTSPGKSGSQVDRILAHRESIVYAGQVTVDDSSPPTRRVASFDLASHWPSRRFGWNTVVRLPKCNPQF